MKKSLGLVDQLYDHQLEEMYPKWEGRNFLTIEQKEFFVMAEEYYGKNIMPEDFLNPPRKYSKKEQKEIIFSLYCISSNETKEQHYELMCNKYPEFQVDNQSYKQMFYYECLRYVDEIGPEKIEQLQRAFNVQVFKNVEEMQTVSYRNSTPFSNFMSSNSLDFFSIFDSAIREADRK